MKIKEWIGMKIKEWNGKERKRKKIRQDVLRQNEKRNKLMKAHEKFGVSNKDVTSIETHNFMIRQ